MRIHSFAARGDSAGVAQELAAGVAIDAAEPWLGFTPLLTALANKQASLALVRFLVEQGANVNVRGWTLETAPAEALAALSPEQRKDQHYLWRGETPLLLAAAAGDPELVTYLIDAGADLQATTVHGTGVLQATVNADVPEEQRSRLIDLLLRHGAALDRADSSGSSPLSTASGRAIRHSGAADRAGAGA